MYILYVPPSPTWCCNWSFWYLKLIKIYIWPSFAKLKYVRMMRIRLVVLLSEIRYSLSNYFRRQLNIFHSSQYFVWNVNFRIIYLNIFRGKKLPLLFDRRSESKRKVVNSCMWRIFLCETCMWWSNLFRLYSLFWAFYVDSSILIKGSCHC